LDPYYSSTELPNIPRLLSNPECLSANSSFYLASRGLVERHPQVLRALFDELTRADRLAQSARQEAVTLVAGFSGLDAAVVSRFIARRPSSPVGLLGAQTVVDQLRVADAFFRLGLIPRQVQVAVFVWRPSAAEYARLAEPASARPSPAL
jgi:sulfonate transport system substrate-binding protein